jgi:hypothetical protein
MFDLINQKFGRLLVLRKDGWIGASIAWACVCDCGREKRATTTNLRSGSTSSCGCLTSERLKMRNPRMTHGMARSATYVSWRCMKTRCSNKNHKHYGLYGGAGITYQESWESFDNFLKDMGEKPNGYTLERIDNSKGYTKENCRWASRKEQARNTRTVRNLTFNGKTMCMLDWSRELNISYEKIKNGIRKGLSAEQILGA